MQPLGVHTSIAGGLHMAATRAAELGCTAVQLFSRSPRIWDTREADKNDAALFKAARADAGIKAVSVHTSYLINLSSPDDRVFNRSVELFRAELNTAAAIGADFLVTHLGSHLGMGGAFALERISLALKTLAGGLPAGHLKVLFENSAGSGNTFGRGINELGMAVKAADALGINAGLCLDTCHAFAAGYRMKSKGDIAALAKEIKDKAGKESLCLVHLNDSKAACGSNTDRHEHLGQGAIGLDGLRAFFDNALFSNLPVILETPKKTVDDDRRNLAVARDILKRRTLPRK